MERVLNQYKRETYISISSYTVWRGSHFVDYTQVHLGDALAVAIHRAGFGTFNDADAGKTAHCIYDPNTGIYIMDFDYYVLLDFYDYSVLPELQDQDALGCFRSFELFGKEHHRIVWNKDEVLLEF